MNTLSRSTLQAFQHFSFACKYQFLKTCPKEFIRFLSKCIVKLLQGNFSEVKRSHVLKYRDQFRELSLFKKNNLEATKKSTFVAKKVYCSKKKHFPTSSLTICFEMEQFVLVLLSVYNSNTLTQPLLQNKNNPNTNLSKLPRTTKVR